MGRLLVVPTPIGNLEDMTFRAVRILRGVPLVLAEDTRRTRKLLAHFDIHTKMLAYHQHNKRSRLSEALDALTSGDVALVSSAGMPSVSDPGFELVQAAVEAGFEVDVLPGPSAVVTAFVGAALPAPGFVFLGFLPRHRSERRARLREVAAYPFAIVLFEAPHRLVSTLEDIHHELGERQMAVARELTKLHQEYVRASVRVILDRYRREEPRGEFVLVVAGIASSKSDASEVARADISRRRAGGERSRAAVAQVAAAYHLPRNQVYAMWLEADQASNTADTSSSTMDDGIIQ